MKRLEIQILFTVVLVSLGAIRGMVSGKLASIRSLSRIVIVFIFMSLKRWTDRNANKQGLPHLPALQPGGQYRLQRL